MNIQTRESDDTTQLVIEWLEEHIVGGEKVLDVGTGTGILAMAALRLGASSALAIDNDHDAAECAKETAVSNNFGSDLEIQETAIEDLDADGFDIVVANLSGKTMTQLCAALPVLLNKGGSACLSGLQQHDYDEIAEALDKVGFRISSRMQRDDWLAVEASCWK